MQPALRVGDLWARLRHDPLQPPLWLELARAYHLHGLPWQARASARQASRLDAALDPEIRALGIALPAQPLAYPDPHPLLEPAGSEARAQQRAALEQWLQQNPDDWLSWLLWLRWWEGPPQSADLTTATQLEPIAGETLHWLGLWRLQAGDPQAAVEAFKGLLDLQPQRHGSMLYLGEALLQLGNTAAAEKAFTRASLSGNPAFLRLLAQRVYANNYWQEAIGVLQKALELEPASIPTLLLLAQLHWDVYDLSAAEQLCQRIQALDPANTEVRYLLNALPGRRGDARAQLEAVQAHHASLGAPGSRLASSIAMASLYCDHLSPPEVAALHRRLCAPIEAAQPRRTAFSNSLDPDRPLRLGLLSADFHRQHPVNLFITPLLLQLQPSQLEVSVYATGGMRDADTRRARQAVAHWHEVANLDDSALQQRISADGIDILLDLAGHTSQHRLGVLALGAAPVQATFLGYPHSTGLSSVDWLIGDPVVSPIEHAPLFSEAIAQLPGSVFCWAPLDSHPLPPARSAKAAPVFGSFNNLMKLSPSTVALWAQLLQALPQARLLLKAPSLRDATVRQQLGERFAAVGVDPARLELEGPSDLAAMMQAYGRIDIALDPFPYNGGTTSLQALWMGVPLISLQGGNFVARMGASFLTSLGHPDWIATSPAEYLAIAGRLVAELPALRQQRAALRQQLIHSPLGDLPSYGRHVQQLLRSLWQRHCRGEPPRSFRLET